MEKIFKAEPESWQIESLKLLATSPRIAIRSAQGVGKTTLMAWAILWFMTTHIESRVVATAPTAHQLYDVLFSELNKWIMRSEFLQELYDVQKTSVRFKGSPETWFCVARTAAKPENLAGFHADNLLFVIDEASGVDDSIYETILGTLSGLNNKLLICGNPTRREGFFYRAFHEERDLYKTLKVSAKESGRVSKENAARLIKQYGEDSDVVRVRVLGEFPKSESDGVIPLELIEKSMNTEPTFRGDLIIGVDVARYGNDKTVMASRIGMSLLPLEVWGKCDLMTTCGRIVRSVEILQNKFSVKRVVINVDDSGLGGGVTDRLREVTPHTINACLNNAKARDSTHYANWITEQFFNFKELLASGEVTLPRDDTLTAELVSRKYSINSAGKLIIEPKSEFKMRIGHSPDRADAVILCYAATTQKVSAPKFTIGKSYWR